jgi:hypothetical protein
MTAWRRSIGVFLAAGWLGMGCSSGGSGGPDAGAGRDGGTGKAGASAGGGGLGGAGGQGGQPSGAGGSAVGGSAGTVGGAGGGGAAGTGAAGTGVAGAGGAGGAKTGSGGSGGHAGKGGAAGAQGLAGQTGAAGAQGLAGQTGAAGNQGLAGQTGAAGDQGTGGQTGAAGDQGLAGQTGAAGDQGTGGQTGAAGDQGLAGQGGGGAGGGTGGVTTPGDSVLMHHNHLNRDGVYIQPALTQAAAAGLHLDGSFRASVDGAIYAQPLYVDNGPGGTDLVIVATESDIVYGLDASSGQQVWSTVLGTPVPLVDMPCGNIDPLGITGTPVIDFASRTMFVGALTTPDDGTSKQYEIYALSIDDGTVRPGWPVDMASTVTGGSTTFQPFIQSQRSALTLVNGILYAPFGGLGGDCGDYRGWMVAIPISDPTNVQAWSTAVRGGGIWSPGGAASDGVTVYATTGNTFGATSWAGGEAIVGFPASLPLSQNPSYWAPNNWLDLDGADLDLGSVGPIVFDLPGATPSHLAMALGKDGKAYLADANNLPGTADPLQVIQASYVSVFGAHAVYSTATATYMVFRGVGVYCSGNVPYADVATLKLVPGAPPGFGPSWCAYATGSGAPMVTTTDGQSDAIVWVVGAESNQLLEGFDGDTGAVIFDGGNSPIGSVSRFSTPIAAKGRIFVAAAGTVVAFTP